MTNPRETALFVAQTGIDCPAVSIGTVHSAIRRGVAKVNSCTDIHTAWLHGVATAQATRALAARAIL